jgi:hypothetical protein
VQPKKSTRLRARGRRSRRDYAHEVEEVDETILLEVDEENEHESFEHANNHSAPVLFDNEEEETNRDERDHEGASNAVVDTWGDSPMDAITTDAITMDAITTDAITHQGIVDEPTFNFVVLDNFLSNVVLVPTDNLSIYLYSV